MAEYAVPDPKLPLRLYLSGKSAAEVAEMIGCEKRTAARLIRENLDVSDIGKWDDSRKKLSGYDGLINEFVSCHARNYQSLLSLSKDVFFLLQKNGYTGSERTVRNYLSRQEQVCILFRQNNGGIYVKGFKHK